MHLANRARTTRPGCLAGRVLGRQGETHRHQQLLIFRFTFRGFGVPTSSLGIFICGISAIPPAALAHTAVVVLQDAYVLAPAENASEWLSSSQLGNMEQLNIPFYQLHRP